jgi:hypothetical protein
MTDIVNSRLPVITDIQPVILSHNSEERFLLAIIHCQQEGGYAADSIMLLAMARTPEELLKKILPRLRFVNAPNKACVMVLSNPSETEYVGTYPYGFITSNRHFSYNNFYDTRLTILDCCMNDIVALDLSFPSQIVSNNDSINTPSICEYARLL